MRGEDVGGEGWFLLRIEEERIGRFESLTLDFSNLFTTSCAMNEEEGEADGEKSDDGCYNCHSASVRGASRGREDVLAPATAAVAFEVAACSLVVGGPS